jgi:hypothetical protein
VNILSPFTREFWIQDPDVRIAVGPLPKRDAVAQARLSAIALESDRDQLRADLMRQRRELKEDLEMVERGLDELDALRVLETAT